MTGRSVGQTSAAQVMRFKWGAPACATTPAMGRLGLALLVLAAACSRASGAPNASSRPLSSLADHRGEKPPGDPPAPITPQRPLLPPFGGVEESPIPGCPHGDEMTNRLRALWGLPPEARIEVLDCVRGRFGRPGWLIDAVVAVPDAEPEHRLEVVASDQADGVIAALAPESLSALGPYNIQTGPGWVLGDLDGDLVDELLQYQVVNEAGVQSTALAVFRLAGGEIVPLGTFVLSYSNRGVRGIAPSRLLECSSQSGLADAGNRKLHILVDGRIETAGRQAQRMVAARCPPLGRRHYQLVGGRLQEVTP
jgi:hypothetical protein